MSKLKKHKTKGTENPNQMTVEALEQKAKSDLEQQNYRRAKEWLRELYRRNKGQYQARLIECYNGLAKQMIEKGQMSEAKTIFDQIRLLTGEQGGTDPFTEVLLATKSGDYKKAAESLIGHYGDGSKPLSAEDSKVMANTLVISFEDFPRLKEVNQGLYEELKAVRRALEHVCAGHLTEAVTELKLIKMQSIFANWRLFIKGLCAFYEGKNDRALEAFSRLGNDPLLSKAVRPFIFIIDKSALTISKDEPVEPLLAQVCRILNRPDMEHVLPRAQYLWRLRRYSDSYEHVARSLTGFPTEEPGLLHTLSKFYFNAVFHMDYQQATRYLKGIHPDISRRKDGFIEQLFFKRVINLVISDDESTPDNELLKLWEEFFIFYQQAHGQNNKVRALVYAHLGDIFSMEFQEDFFSPFFRPKKGKVVIRNYKLAEKVYEQSLTLNNADKEVHLNLLRLYEKNEEKSKRNRKLDEMTRLFPDDKDTLAKNGNFCIERKSFIKGIEYLKKAVALDPLDRYNKDALCIGYIKASVYFAGKGNNLRYREFMNNAIEMGQTGLESMTLGRPYLETRLVIFEWLAGYEKEGSLLFENVMEQYNNEPRLTYFAYLIGRIYGITGTWLIMLEKQVKIIFQNPVPALAAAFTDIIGYINHINMPRPWIYNEFEQLNRYAIAAANMACTIHNAEKIVRYALSRERSGEMLAKKYIRKILKQDPQNPLFLYFEYTSEAGRHLKAPKENDVEKLKDILAIAIERNERLLIDTLNKTIREIEVYLASLKLPYEIVDDEWDDEEYEDETSKTFEKIAGAVLKGLNPSKKPSPRPEKKKLDQPSLFDDFN